MIPILKLKSHEIHKAKIGNASTKSNPCQNERNHPFLR
jgi:hypothetical protein